MPRNDFADTSVISTQLHLCDSAFVMTRFTARRTAPSLSNPKAVILISPAMKKNVHPALLIAVSRPFRSRLLTDLQLLEKELPSSRKDSGMDASRSMSMVPVLTASVIASPYLKVSLDHGPLACRWKWFLFYVRIRVRPGMERDPCVDERGEGNHKWRQSNQEQ